ncbi:transposase [Niabella sp. CC-SYL272]|uniref:transposase n=1 Tax=Niabella agricola TaxID=2891571 RepID=UPI001F2BA0DB|nr:transposase [Niabella agricola]MCF3109241.1 transposase [Niabella agricola]MCF3110435.1 transposase [Niabella agricola]
MIKVNKETKEAIVAEYLSGGTSFRKLASKYGITSRRVYYWVKCHQDNQKEQKQLEIEAVEPLPTEVKQLQAELRRAKLHNELLEEMLRLSENLTGVELRKKFGTRQL